MGQCKIGVKGFPSQVTACATVRINDRCGFSWQSQAGLGDEVGILDQRLRIGVGNDSHLAFPPACIVICQRNECKSVMFAMC